MLGMNQHRSELVDDENVEINMEDLFQGKVILNIGQTATLHLDGPQPDPDNHCWHAEIINHHHHLGLVSENHSILPVQIQINESSNIISTESSPMQPGRQALLKLRAVRKGNVELQCFCSPAIGCMTSQGRRKCITVHITVRPKPISTGLRIILQGCKERRYIEEHAARVASVTLTDLLCHGGIEPILPPHFGALISEFDVLTA